MPKQSPRTAEILATVAALIDPVTRAGYTITGVREIDYGRQVGISNGHTHISVNIYGGKRGISVVVAGNVDRPLHAAVSRIAASLGVAALASSAGAPAVHQGTAKAALPASGRPLKLASRFPDGPWIGSDESGKGDYFGPLVAAAVYVAPRQEGALRAAGVCDSKLLDDTTARRVASDVRRLCAGRFAEEVLPPQEYNTLYEQFRSKGENLNHLLAGRHVLAIDALLIGGNLPAEPAPTVIADRFGNERYLRERLQQTLEQRGLPMPALLQVPRAEANVAVAAASILARDRFLTWLAGTSARYDIDLPKGGAKPSIVAAARRIIERHGIAELGKIAKLHFATTRSLDLPDR